MIYNPLDREVSKTLSIPLYYTGIDKKASVSEQGAAAHTFRLQRNYTIDLPVVLPAHATTWFLMR